MPGEIERFRTPQDTKEEKTSAFVYRAIRFDEKKKKYILVSSRQEAGYSGKTDVTMIEFDDPGILDIEISVLDTLGTAYLHGTATVTKTHEEWDHSGDRGNWKDYHAPDDVTKGDVFVHLTVENGALAPFESTIKLFPLNEQQTINK
jgi:hypothetical protein